MGLLALLASGASVAAEEPGHDDHADHVELTPAEQAEFGIEVREATGGAVQVTLSLPGEVQPNGDRLAHIVPRYPGVVLETRAAIGDRVEQGDVLAVVESDEALTTYELRTLLAGTVIAKHITRGEAVSRDKGTYLIADLDTVWVDLAVYQRDIDRIRVGQRVLLHSGHGPVEAEARISYLTPVMDERTRTATARLVLPNPGGRWRPGTFVTADVVVETVEAPVVVPATALLRMDDHAVVFVETDEGFTPREVTIGARDREAVVITAGIRPGERYVAAGGFTLKAEMEKGGFGGGHAH
jgi:cobalt-zinc-cadmium efflux system membrane fusion protein